jgi:lipopolysaccharide export system permease protein
LKTIHLMLLRSFLMLLAIALLFFVLLVQLFDVFANLWRYLAQDTGALAILRIAWLYLPKCVSYALGPALLFACAYTLGLLYKNNELIAILGSGLSLFRLLAPLLALGLLVSVASFWFEERVVIDSLRLKNQLYRSSVKLELPLSRTNVTVTSADGRIVYQADYYDDKKQSLSGVLILRRDAQGRFESRADAERAAWSGGHWVLHNTRSYVWDPAAGLLRESRAAQLEDAALSEPPATFRKSTRRVEEMGAGQARDFVGQLRRAGLPYREALTEYYRKYFVALNPLIVLLIASGVGGRFRKNVLLLSLLTSLLLSVLYYVGQMITLILAKNAVIPPLAGAALSFLVFLAGGILILRTART